MCVTQSSKLSQMDVSNFCSAQFFPQSLLVKLRIVARARNAAHVYNALDVVGSQNRKELFPCSIGMPNGENCKGASADFPHEGMLMQRGKSGNVTYGI
jgi:hypothetical protein